MRIVWLAGFALLFAAIGMALTKLVAGLRVRRQAKGVLADLHARASKAGSEVRLLRGRLRATGDGVAPAPASAPKIVALTQWVSRRRFQWKDALVEATKSSTGLSLDTAEGVVPLDGSVEVSMGSRWSWSGSRAYDAIGKGFFATTSLSQGDEVVVLDPSSLAGYRDKGEPPPASPEDVTFRVAVTGGPRVALTPWALVLHPLAILITALGLIPGWVYGKGYDEKRAECANRCGTEGLCHLVTWIGRHERRRGWTRPSALDELEGDLFTCVAAADSDCKASAQCKYGGCTEKNGECIAASDADCRTAQECVQSGACGAVAGACKLTRDEDCPINGCLGLGHCSVSEYACKAGSDEDCRKSYDCNDYGLCFAVDGECVEKPGSVVAPNCKGSLDCLESGRCSPSGKDCVTASNEDCLGSRECAESDHCRAQDGRCLAEYKHCPETEACRIYGHCQDVGASGCQVGSDSDCRDAVVCKARGQCHKIGNECVKDCQSSLECALYGLCGETKDGCTLATAEGCKHALACAEQGLCSLADGRCVAGSDADCQPTEGCRKDGKCSATPLGEAYWAGTCAARKDADCQKTAGCQFDGRCSARDSHCVAATDPDCARSIACKVDWDCVAKDESCQMEPPSDRCRTSRECKVLGHCSVGDFNQCAAKTDADCASSDVCALRGWCIADSQGDCFAKR